jgi:hypothetical protein
LYKFTRKALKVAEVTQILFKYQSLISSSYLDEFIGDFSVGLDITDQLSITYFALVIYNKLGVQIDSTPAMHKLQEAYNSVRGEVLYNILIKFEVLILMVRLIKVCLTRTYSKVNVVEYLSDTFAIQNGLEQGDAILPSVLNLALEYAITKVQENQMALKLNGTHHLLLYADDINLFVDHIYNIKKHRKFL